MTCGFSRVIGKGSWSSAAKPSSGDSVPDVSSIHRTFAAARTRMATPAPKHQYDSVGVGRDPCKMTQLFCEIPKLCKNCALGRVRAYMGVSTCSPKGAEANYRAAINCPVAGAELWIVPDIEQPKLWKMRAANKGWQGLTRVRTCYRSLPC